MPNTIKETVTLAISGPNFSASLGGTVSTVQVGSNYNEESQIATSASSVKINVNPNIADGNLGFMVVRNITPPIAGAAAADQPYVDIATDSGMVNKIASIQPGKGFFFPPPGGTTGLWMQAHLQDTPVVFLAVET